MKDKVMKEIENTSPTQKGSLSRAELKRFSKFQNTIIKAFDKYNSFGKRLRRGEFDFNSFDKLIGKRFNELLEKGKTIYYKTPQARLGEFINKIEMEKLLNEISKWELELSTFYEDIKKLELELVKMKVSENKKEMIMDSVAKFKFKSLFLSTNESERQTK